MTIPPSAFDSPVTPCPAPPLPDALRALEYAHDRLAADVESLQRRAWEIDAGAYAAELEVVGRLLAEARGRLGHG